jgi:BirA family biotin operon repressor/biotin-[acetyl-CoA-carboxylase] ligase
MTHTPLNIIKLDEVNSTNTAMALMGDEAVHATVLRAVTQSAGRGQRGNSWESEPGKNLTFSICLRPQHIPARTQFELSMAVSLGVVHALDAFIDPKRVKIKWPNDIYVDDLKIAGILIENSIDGTVIRRSIVGIGLNINQLTFVSDAPNPVSLAALTDRTYDLDAMLTHVCQHVVDMVDRHDADLMIHPDHRESVMVHNPEQTEIHADTLLDAYIERLWRGDNSDYRWHDALRDIDFTGAILSVDRDGTLTIIDRTDGTPRRYQFKEVAALL